MFRFTLTCGFAVSIAASAFAQSWNGYGANAQHSAVFAGLSQPVSSIHWQSPLDDDRAYYGGEVLIHYASPMITTGNTVVHGYRFTTQVNNSSYYDNWEVFGRSAGTGAQLWQMTTDFSAALLFPSDWTSVFPVTLFSNGSGNPMGVAAAASGGSIMVRASADASSSNVSRLVFYTTLSDFQTNQAAYAPVKICTPLTSDNAGNIYFGYEVTASVPPNLSPLGTGGVAKVNAITGVATYKSVQAMGIDSSISAPAVNAAPALSLDQTDVYVALTGGNPYLAKLSASNLTPLAHVLLLDPSIPGANATLLGESSASPMIGTDGHVFMGVFGNQWRESHGWMLQFDGNLNAANPTTGKTYPAGAFGWDDTASVVPSSIVPSYRGNSRYLIVTKYNNYDDNGSDPGADGSNHVAVLDPSSNSVTTDRQSGIPVMNEVLLILSPSLINNDTNHPNARFEWCINSVAVDVAQKGAIINCEDGHVYRWSFVTNSITQALYLQPATGEAYTSTSIGPDGQIYAISNAILFAIGSSPASHQSGIGVISGGAAAGGLSAATVGAGSSKPASSTSVNKLLSLLVGVN